MPATTQESRIDQPTIELVSALAKTFFLKVSQDFEEEDLRADLLCHLVAREHTFNPEEVTWKTFVIRVTGQAWIDLLRESNAQKRNGIMVELDAPVSPEATETLGDTLVDPGTENTIRPWDLYEKEDLIQEVRALVAQLPPNLKVVAEALMVDDPAEAMIKLKLQPRTFYYRMTRLKQEAVRKLCRKQVIDRARLQARNHRKSSRKRRDFLIHRRHR